MSQLAEAIMKLNEEEVARLVREKLDVGEDAMSIVNECREGMDLVGERYKAGDYFLSELIVSGEVFKDAMRLIQPHLETGKGRGEPIKVVLATVKGDIHSLGKDIVVVLLRAAGFEVYDLGIDVAPNVIVDKLLQTEAPILGMSGMVTPSFDSMKETVESVVEAGLRAKTNIILGGGIITELVANYAGADAYTNDAVEGIEIIRGIVGHVK